VTYRTTVERDVPESARELIDLVRTISDGELAPRASRHEAEGGFAHDSFGLLARAGLTTLPMPDEFGGGGVAFSVYLQVLEEIAARWVTIALGISVHTLACGPTWRHGTQRQKERLATRTDQGLGAYCLSEAHAGSDPAASLSRAVAFGERWVATGTKAWITNAAHAEFYTSFLRTGEPGSLSCFVVAADTPGLSFGVPENKMGLKGSPTATVTFDSAVLPGDALVGHLGQGLPIALEALDAGRLGVAAIAVGLAQSALDYAVDYACHREAFGSTIIDHQGVSFLLADMAAAVESSRATYLAAARRMDEGKSFGRAASIAKLVATDAAMKVTTDAVQVLGGAGYVSDHPVERYMREAKVMQIFEGTNQIQRMVIGRHLAKSRGHQGVTAQSDGRS